MENADFVINIDGASRGNPGQAAYAFSATANGRVVAEDCRRIGRATNNVAEYTALVKALEWAKTAGAGGVVIQSDSELLVKQMTGAYKVKSPDLIDLAGQAKRLAVAFRRLEFRHIPREKNSRADQLCNDVLDGKDRATDSAPGADLDEAAVGYLETVADAWAAGKRTGPTPRDVWNTLRDLAEKMGCWKDPDR